MLRTQIQLPNRLHRSLKRLAEREEVSLAEIVRRAAEYFIGVHPEIESAPNEWELPKPRDLGRILAPENEWRLLANEPVDTESPGP